MKAITPRSQHGTGLSPRPSNISGKFAIFSQHRPRDRSEVDGESEFRAKSYRVIHLQIEFYPPIE